MRGWVSKLLGLVAVLVATGFVALAGVGGWLYWNRVELRTEEATGEKAFEVDEHEHERSQDISELPAAESARTLHRAGNR